MNPLLIKWINPLTLKWAAIAVLAVFFYWKGSNWVDEYREMKATYQQTVQQLVTERNNARIEAESFKAALREKAQHEEWMELLLADALKRQDAARKEAREQQKIFERHNFEALTQAKPGLIENLANKATQERLDAFEDAFNN